MSELERKWSRQFLLVSGRVHTRCSLEDDPRLVVGAVITLPKADIGPKNALWTIMVRGDTRTQERKIGKKWTVGGVYIEQPRQSAETETP